VPRKRNFASLQPHQDVLRLAGEIDLARRPGLIAATEARLGRSPWLIVDLTAVTFMDCAGLGTLLAARSRAKALGGGLALVGASARMSRLLELTSLDQVFRVYPDVSSAEASLRANRDRNGRHLPDQTRIQRPRSA